MKFKCCENLLHTLNFQYVGLLACGFTFWGDYYGEIFSIEDYKKARDKYVAKFKSGDIPKLCTTCGILTEREWDESIGLSGCEITNRPRCSVCDCIYCIATDADAEKKKYFNNYEPYDIKPALLNLRNNNVFLPNCRFDINGGEIAEYPEEELQWFVYIAMKQKSPLSFLSSGIVFSQTLHDALRLLDTDLMISVDAGTEKTYEKIKRVKNKFNNVWSNLDKYIKSANNNPNSKVSIKYIIIPGINDNVNEAQAFVKKCLEVNCKNIVVSMELHFKRNNYHEKVSGHLRETMEYFSNLVIENVKINYAPEAIEYFNYQLSLN